MLGRSVLRRRARSWQWETVNMLTGTPASPGHNRFRATSRKQLTCYADSLPCGVNAFTRRTLSRRGELDALFDKGHPRRERAGAAIRRGHTTDLHDLHVLPEDAHR